MTPIERIKEFIDFKRLNIASFERIVGFSNGAFASQLKRKGTIGLNKLENILLKFPELNPTWVMTGKEEMLNGNNNTSATIIKSSNSIPQGAIPYYDLPISAGHSPFDVKGAIKPDGYVVDLPGIGYTEAFLPVHGYSMHPEVKDGSIIGVKSVDSWDHLNTQYKYLIISHEDRMIKYIEHDESNNDILWCNSPNYKRFSILKSDIIKVYRVTFVMNPE